MSKNYIKKFIEEEIPFEPDYSKIKEQVNIMPKQANKKRWVWPSLSIVLVSLAVIVTIIISLSLRSSTISNHEGVHFNNYTSNGSGGDSSAPLPPPPMVKYSIDVEKDNYDYNEEFIIRYIIQSIDGYGVADSNNLNVKIISDKFEFLSPTEYHFDLETDISTYGNILSFGNEEKTKIFPIEMELKVKAKKQNDTVDYILFLLEFPLSDSYKELLKNYCAEEEGYRDSIDEFTKDFEWIHRFSYLNDELGTLLVDGSKVFKYHNTDPRWADTIRVTPRTEIMYRSLNRLYKQNLISKEKYIKRLICYFTNDVPYLGFGNGAGIYEQDDVFYQYFSRNLKIQFELNDKYVYLNELYQKDQESRIQMAKELLKMIYEEGKITLDEYNNEILMIDKEGLLRDGSWKGYFYQANTVLIPFKDYKEYYFDMYIKK